MNMMRFTHVLIGMLLLCVACKNSEKETPSGMKFTVVKAGDGKLAKKGEIVVFDFVMKDSKDSVWKDSRADFFPGVVQIQDSTMLASENGLVQMFRQLSKGDSVKVEMPITKFFKDMAKSPIPQEVDSTLLIGYYIHVREVMPEDSFRVFQERLMVKRRDTQKEKDKTDIKKYLADNKITAQEDTSGIYYVIHAAKGGKKPTPDNCVSVKYTGKFMKDGQIFDKNDNVAFPLNGVIQGWRLGIPMLGIGDSATFYIPSGLAYGPQGYPGAIPPDAILIFDVELLGMGASFDQVSRSCK